MARPKSRAETVIFSRKAVVCRDADGTLCLSFRVGDFRSSQLIGVRINALVVQKVLPPPLLLLLLLHCLTASFPGQPG